MFDLRHLRRTRALRAERGDTLIEVLLAIAIVSTILSGAYIVTNKSLLASREAQERGNALKLSQGQIERLKSISISSDADTLFAPGLTGTFCIDDSNQIKPTADNACNVNARGQYDGLEPIYHLSLVRDPADVNTFELTSTWASLRNSGNNSVKLTYKVYP